MVAWKMKTIGRLKPTPPFTAICAGTNSCSVEYADLPARRIVAAIGGIEQVLLRMHREAGPIDLRGGERVGPLGGWLLAEPADRRTEPNGLTPRC